MSNPVMSEDFLRQSAAGNDIKTGEEMVFQTVTISLNH